MTNHEQAAMDFLHSSAWLNAGDIFAQQKAIADFAASLAPRPSNSHKQAAREIVQRVCDGIADRAREPDGVKWFASDDGPLAMWHETIAAALARVERETIERCAKVAESVPLYFDTPDCAEQRDSVLAAIRALAEEDAK